MRQLSWVQFFSWFGLFGMWVFTTPAIAHHIYGLPITDSKSEAYQNAGDWVGVLFGIYNLVSAFYAFALPYIAKKFGRKLTHSISLIIGGFGLISIYFVPNEDWLVLSMIGVGIAWASILSMPYAMLASTLPQNKLGVYMGIFNFFIVLPEIIATLFFGWIMDHVLDNNRLAAVMVGGGLLAFASLLCLQIREKKAVII